MKYKFISGSFFILFSTVSVFYHFGIILNSIGNMASPTAKTLSSGLWQDEFNKTFADDISIATWSKKKWGFLEYNLFHEGRKGVILGQDGWLFTDEEFSCPSQYQKNFSAHIKSIKDVFEKLLSLNIQMIAVIVPSKARVYAEKLRHHRVPRCRSLLYQDILFELRKIGIDVVDLLPLFQKSIVNQQMYLKTDTHWSPIGARISAMEISKKVESDSLEKDIPQKIFKITEKSLKSYHGDLQQYVPGAEMSEEIIQNFEIEEANDHQEENLFDEKSAPKITLIGTSYSANATWNFLGFLKAALSADIFNAAKEGRGPFFVMEKYLNSDVFLSAPPRLVIWEIPERYFLLE